MYHKFKFLVFLLGTFFLFNCKADSTCYLDPQGSNNNSCSTSQDACKTISYCLASRQGQGTLTISLNNGTYWGENCGVNVNTSLSINNLILVGTDAIIDCMNKQNHFTFNNTNATFTLSTLTLRNGNTIGNGGCVAVTQVKGILIQSVTFQNCTAVANGGALYSDSTATILDSIFVSNVAGSGGALYLAPPFDGTSASKCSITSNSAYNGGGIFIEGDYIAITDGNITSNSAVVNGGGVFLRSNSPNTMGAYNFMGTTIAQNKAQHGGGLYAQNLNHTWNVFGALLQDNSALDYDPNVACGDYDSPFCFACTATDCHSDCDIKNNQSCSQNTSTTASVMCYSTKFSTCNSYNETCTCQTSGLPTAAKVLIVVIAVCLVVGIVLILVDVIKALLRRGKHQYTPIKQQP